MDAPKEAENVPAPQSEHVLEPVTAENVPESHREHCDAPAMAEYAPRPHIAQRRAEVPKKPVGHWKQVDEPVVDELPRAQSKHSVAPAQLRTVAGIGFVSFSFRFLLQKKKREKAKETRNETKVALARKKGNNKSQGKEQER